MIIVVVGSNEFELVFYRYYRSPCGQNLRSMKDVERFVEDFDFLCRVIYSQFYWSYWRGRSW